MAKIVDMEDEILSCLTAKDYDRMYELVDILVQHFLTKRHLIGRVVDKDFAVELTTDYCMLLIQKFNANTPILRVYGYLKLWYIHSLKNYIKNEVPGYSLVQDCDMVGVLMSLYGSNAYDEYELYEFQDFIRSVPRLVRQKLKRVGPVVDKNDVLNAYVSTLLSLLKNADTPIRLSEMAKPYFHLVWVNSLSALQRELQTIIGEKHQLTTDELLNMLVGDAVNEMDELGG